MGRVKAGDLVRVIPAPGLFPCYHLPVGSIHVISDSTGDNFAGITSVPGEAGRGYFHDRFEVLRKATYFEKALLDNQ